LPTPGELPLPSVCSFSNHSLFPSTIINLLFRDMCW
jgi:hypothetical protein